MVPNLNSFLKGIALTALIFRTAFGFHCSTNVKKFSLSTSVPRARSVTSKAIPLFMAEGDGEAKDPDELITASIKVKGDVGGYYRACVLNEAGKFRRLTGTMTPMDDTNEAEIYVEGKRKKVEGFVRWVKRGKIGLSQKTEVTDVTISDEPLGIYDDFYCKTQ